MAEGGHRSVTDHERPDRRGQQAVTVVTTESLCNKTNKTQGDSQLRGNTSPEEHAPTRPEDLAQVSSDVQIDQALSTLQDLGSLIVNLEAEIIGTEGVLIDSGSSSSSSRVMSVVCEGDRRHECHNQSSSTMPEIERPMQGITSLEEHTPTRLQRSDEVLICSEEEDQASSTLQGLRARLANLEAEIMNPEGLFMNSSSRMTTACDTRQQDEVSSGMQRSERHIQSSPTTPRLSGNISRREHESFPHTRRSADHQTQDEAQRGSHTPSWEASPHTGQSGEECIGEASHGVPDRVAARDETPQQCLLEMEERIGPHMFSLPTFTGRSRGEYCTFIERFHQYVNVMLVPDACRLELLVQVCTSWREKVALASCLDLGPIAGYEKALAILRERFGDNYLCDEKMVTAMQGSPVGANDVKGLEELVDDLWFCIDGLRLLGMTPEVDLDQYVRGIASRLTGKAWEQYEEEVYEYWERHGAPPGIEWLMEFIKKVANEAREQNNLGRRGQCEARKESLQGDTWPAGHHTHKRATAGQGKNTSTSCPLCHHPHALPLCAEFRKMAVKQRRKIVRRLQCCFSCLDATHTTPQCRRKDTCSVEGCRAQHSKWLHLKNPRRRKCIHVISKKLQ